MLPKDILSDIERLAGKRRCSEFLAEAAREKLAKAQFMMEASGLAGALAKGDYPEYEISCGACRYIRQLRESNGALLQCDLRPKRCVATYLFRT